MEVCQWAPGLQQTKQRKRGSNISISRNFGRILTHQRKLINCFWRNVILIWHRKFGTVFLILLHTPSFLLEIRVIIKISSHPWYHINCDWFEKGWIKKNSKWPTQKNWDFQLRQFSIFFCENFRDWFLGN